MASLESKWYDASLLRRETGEADVDISAAVYTAYVALLTIAPPLNTALRNVTVEFDLDKATTGWADVGTSETLQLAIQRKVDGTNWRTDKLSETTAIAASASDDFSKRLVIGDVDPDEQVRVVVKLSAEPGSDVELPFRCKYRSQVQATFTAVAAV